LSDENGKRVYVLTGPKNPGTVIFGNDYLLLFDHTNKLLNKESLHKNIISTDYGKKDGEIILGGMHTHLASTGEYITSTDICTLMLYEKFANWKQYYVMSDKYVSIWNCDRNQLNVLTKKAWEKINKDQAEKKKVQQADADKADRTYNELNYHDDQFDLSDAMLALAISLMAVTALTQKRWLFVLAMFPTLFGVIMGLAGLLGWHIHPDSLTKLLS